MILRQNCPLPGIISTGWADNTLEILEVGRILHIYHRVPESLHTAFLRGEISLKELDQKYNPKILNPYLG